MQLRNCCLSINAWMTIFVFYETIKHWIGIPMFKSYFNNLNLNHRLSIKQSLGLFCKVGSVLFGLAAVYSDPGIQTGLSR